MRGFGGAALAALLVCGAGRTRAEPLLIVYPEACSAAVSNFAAFKLRLGHAVTRVSAEDVGGGSTPSWETLRAFLRSYRDSLTNAASLPAALAAMRRDLAVGRLPIPSNYPPDAVAALLRSLEAFEREVAPRKQSAFMTAGRILTALPPPLGTPLPADSWDYALKPTVAAVRAAAPASRLTTVVHVASNYTSRAGIDYPVEGDAIPGDYARGQDIVRTLWERDDQCAFLYVQTIPTAGAGVFFSRSEAAVLRNVTGFQLIGDPTLVHARPDRDGDGLLDPEEAWFGTSATSRDTDADGGADGDEVIAGTSPTNREDRFAVEAVSADAGVWAVSWHGVLGRLYTLYETTDPAGPWTPSQNATNLPGSGARLTVEGALPVSHSCFYRLGVRLRD
jgi:hypothetical protein